MSSAVILQHVPYAGPGNIVPVLRDFGIPLDIRHVYRGDEVPTDLDELRLLIVLGGPMNVSDVGDSRYPFLAREVELLKRVVAVDRPVLGIALGAQLLAHAAGAKVHANTIPAANPEDLPVPAAEFGWFGVTFPFPGGTEPIVYGMSDGAPFFHWHADTLELPRLPAPPNPAPPPAPPPPSGNALLASSKLCKNQAFRFKNRLFGFQFHFELDPQGVQAIVENDRSAALDQPAKARIADETKRFSARSGRLGRRLLDNFVQYLKAY
jgi:GMP synthase (glutamine-hydrolysing)